MKIIDAQIHVWQASTSEDPWPTGAVSLHGDPVSIERALAVLDQAGVDAAVLVPPSWVSFSNRYSLEAARLHPDRFRVFGRFDIAAPEGPQYLSRWLEQPGMLGIRMLLNAGTGLDALTDRSFDWFWQGCEACRIPLMCFTPLNARALGPIAERHPTLRLIVDHAGRNPRGEKDEAAWSDLDELTALGRFQNVAVKVSSLPCFANGPYPFTALHKPVRAIYDAFGPQRMMWGSDLSRLTSSYEENLRLFTEGLEFLSGSDREWILGKALAKFCGWQL